MTKSVGWLCRSREGTGLVLQLYSSRFIWGAERYYVIPDDKQIERKTFIIDTNDHRYLVYNLRKLLDDEVDHLPVFES